MKVKGLVVALCLMLGVLAFSIGSANAAFTYYTCTISAAGGISNGSVYIIVTDTAATPAFTDTYFVLDNSTGQANQFLAAALTAWASAGKVKVLLNTPINAYDLCFGVACTN
jgi:hypothetical protein